MGPRLFSRGKRRREPTGGLRAELQWGRGCSAAERSSRRPNRERDTARQWGRGCSAAERPPAPAPPGSPAGFNGAAAVQPRKVRRDGSKTVTGDLLQWGRGCSAAERGLGLSGWCLTTCRLQWGRGCSAAERAFSADSLPACKGFNGAAAVQPRKVTQGLLCPVLRHRFNGAAAVQPRKDAQRPVILGRAHASMGPRLFSRGKPPPEPTPPYAPSCASMGPRLFSRGKAAVRRWAVERAVLQWGRGCSAAESQSPHTASLAVFELQWGRGCSAAESSVVAYRRLWGILASMGPRLFSRGKVAIRAFVGAGGGASMGPRLFSRGKGGGGL